MCIAATTRALVGCVHLFLADSWSNRLKHSHLCYHRRSPVNSKACHNKPCLKAILNNKAKHSRTRRRQPNLNSKACLNKPNNKPILNNKAKHSRTLKRQPNLNSKACHSKPNLKPILNSKAYHSNKPCLKAILNSKASLKAILNNKAYHSKACNSKASLKAIPNNNNNKPILNNKACLKAYLNKATPNNKASLKPILNNKACLKAYLNKATPNNKASLKHLAMLHHSRPNSTTTSKLATCRKFRHCSRRMPASMLRTTKAYIRSTSLPSRQPRVPSSSRCSSNGARKSTLPTLMAARRLIWLHCVTTCRRSMC